MTDQLSHQYEARGKHMAFFLYISIFTFLDKRREGKNSEPNGGKHSPNSIFS